jgi:tetratricopeptide (TPR) repeat protein
MIEAHGISRDRRNMGLPLVVALLFAALFAPATPAHAGKIMFGTSEHLEKIQDVAIKGQNGEALYLGYKFSHHSFVAPYMLTDDGYILGVVGQNRFYKLDAAAIENFQARGLLPKPLPPYEISFVDYLFGNLLWIVLAFIGVGAYFTRLKSKKQQATIPIANEGLEHERNGDWDGAIAKYTKALDIHPKFAEVLCRRANAYNSKHDFDRAIADYSKAISAEPKNVMALLGRATVLEAKQLGALAISDYTRAIKISKAGFAYFARGLAQMNSGDVAAAIKDFTSAIGKEPKFAAAYYNRAVAYERTGKRVLAQEDYRRASELAAQHQAASPQAT